ncbi:UDP-N-acetylmuramoyl-L-alanyl-D-glutamate--2,6-diaminopimelate ligase [Lachnospiraceae bacterium C1.1]|nr:UDP-N-acetylmuramoyl-L-alanyl-D-glutamate--2,6-diaminopimelate ligase [Lachnospiraceae bacterium C1.1]
MKKLKDLIAEIDYSLIAGTIAEQEISELVYDSRKISKDCLFVCIEGANFDGHTAAKDAFEKGAAAVIVEKNIDSSESGDTAVIKVESTRYALAFTSAAWFGNPADEMKIIGITGTKGKTTTSFLTKAILEAAGHKVGLIGTIETIIGDEHIPAKNTTPESYILQETFRKMADEGCDSVVMEVSSQALMMHRSQGFIFDYGVFTNIEPDHIGPGEHKDFEDYLHCKGLLFKQCKVGIVNGDDPHVEELLKGHSCEVQTFGRGEKNDLRVSGEELVKIPGELGVKFKMHGIKEMEAEVGTPGEFSVYNALCAAAVCLNFGVSDDAIKNALKNARVKGRIESVKVSDKFSLLIDYAHNAMALESLLTSLRKYEPKRLVSVFGCGGNRSKLRRFEMGEVSGKYADFTIITSDNPRFEEPEAIMDDIETGIKKTDGKYIRISDRKEAIRYAIENGQEGDLIILAGKGHEDYQEIKGVKYPMDERVLIAEVLEELKK